MKKLKIFYSFLIFLTIFIWFVILSLPDGKLHIYACDVGQGDGFLVTKDNTQVVIDGGPNNNISSCVSNHMPFWDREIEMIVSTHPDRDHYYGLINLINNYKVDVFIAPSMSKEATDDYKKLLNAVNEHQIKVINPYIGDIFQLGNLSFDIDWPSKEAFSQITDDNLLGIVMTARYNNFSQLFTADVEFNNADSVLETGKITSVNVLKVPHHGSKNGLTEDLILATHPEAAIISVGLNNQFGHPDAGVIKLLTDRGIKIYRTDQMGEIEVVTDGQSYQVIP